ncbi:glycosyltransferase family 1 protein [Flavihumibacter sp. R14]|nr:glycosyltransferase family 1 protein [Flavihumibacter soli]
MKITLFTLGTRGDVQPFAILGEALARRGHTVTLCTAKNFRTLVESHHINFHPVNIDSEFMINSKQGQQIMKVNLFHLKRNLKKFIYPIIKTSLNEFYKMAQESDLVIYRTKTLADVFLTQLDCHAIRAAVVPAMEETTAFLNPIMSGLKIPAFLNRWSYKFNELRFMFFKKPIEQFRLQHGLSEDLPELQGIPGIYGISKHFLDRPEDWANNHHLTGFWFSQTKNELDPELDQFISSGKPPLLITFSSMPVAKELHDLIIDCISKFDERFIIIKGWGEWNLSDSPNIKIIDSAPFDALFPRMRAIIHHGGLGTTAECLRAGKPMFICPPVFPFGDQYFWGDLAHRKGVAVKPLPLPRFTAEKFDKGVRQLLTDEKLYRNSITIAKKINAENGVEKAVETIERIIKANYLRRSA